MTLTDLAAADVKVGDAIHARDVKFYVVSSQRLSGDGEGTYRVRLTGIVEGVGVATVFLTDDWKVAVER